MDPFKKLSSNRNLILTLCTNTEHQASMFPERRQQVRATVHSTGTDERWVNYQLALHDDQLSGRKNACQLTRRGICLFLFPTLILTSHSSCFSFFSFCSSACKCQEAFKWELLNSQQRQNNKLLTGRDFLSYYSTNKREDKIIIQEMSLLWVHHIEGQQKKVRKDLTVRMAMGMPESSTGPMPS